MAGDSAAEVPHSRFFVLALGLLVGFVTGFVVLLAHLPVDQSVVDYQAQSDGDWPVAGTPTKFDFYEVLAAQTRRDEPAVSAASVASAEPAAPRVETQAATRPAAARPIVKPATRVVPGSAQIAGTPTLAEQTYAAIPVASRGRESYFLQAGSFREPDAAERRRAAVLMLGLDAFIVTRQDASGALGHRVRIGPFYDQNRLTEAKKRLRRGEMEYEIIRVTG